ncbi:sigma-70 family RNA polymerase sigma factor [Streptomyces sp. NPDC006265]|uniref:RNA polymerase sigma factor n=1 Tax=Streptomyces sp. NPDC006265 TaxID=3156740 RepID=UPI0033AAED35
MTTERAEIEEAGGTADGGFAGFFERSYPGMLARALLLCGHRQDAEDAVQEGYAEAFRRWERLRAYDAPDAWVYRVVRQRLWAAGRRRARRRSAETRLPQPPPTASVEQTAEARAVLSALAGLPPRQRTVLVLHCLEGMTQAEIAEELGLRRGSVAAGVFRARRHLERGLGMVDDEGGGDRDGLHGWDELVPSGAFRDAPAANRIAGPEPADPLAGALRRTELWLRGGVAARSDALDAALAAVTGAVGSTRAAGPEGTGDRT